ncbi:L-amino acid N-acyltransferase YncA [Chitinophaga sp. CF118]|uniref:GNAT family N-acetyltransferase n=1 Tax=Chitinophaga sp. CF118 TaxID=1884367 RepID=UPI0008F1DF94|nr:GNAT family N-acetyltransferase [Chitinophaga sp. CF118]SFE10360.1 L-amino acid N-acyltransferase YncA [Chitinophaga sp. CF118]
MFNIKAATTEDIPVIELLVEQIWRPTYEPILTPVQIDYMVKLMYSKEELTKQLADQGHRFLLLYDDATPIGYASYSNTDTAGIYKLQKIYVHQAYQGKGVGKLFLNSVIDAVKAAKGMILELNVNKYNNKALLFYEKQGFVVYLEKDFDIGNGFWMNDYVMRKEL